MEKEYLFNFIGGGWNSEMALSKKGAINQAREKYSLTLLQIDEKSFRLSTKKDKDQLLSLFY